MTSRPIPADTGLNDMPIPAAALEADPRFFYAFRQGARLLLDIYDADPPLGRLFSSQQRWLMSHAAFALACSRDPADPASGLYTARFIALVLEKNVASKNTAADFIQEIVANGFVRVVSGHEDRRRKPLQATDVPDRAMSQWLELHLAGLDGIDGGNRADIYRADPTLQYRLQPKIAERILVAGSVRSQGPAFDLFTWANFGGLILDLLIAGVDAGAADAGPATDRLPAGTLSLTETARRFTISRTHVVRLFGKAAELGDIGWSGRRGESDVWISRRLLRQYWQYQAAKHALVDEAFAEVTGSRAARTT